MQCLAVCMCVYAYSRAHIHCSICKSQPSLRLRSLTDDGRYNVKAHVFTLLGIPVDSRDVSTQHDWSDSVSTVELAYHCILQLMVPRIVWWQACTNCVAVYTVARLSSKANACCSKSTHMSLHNVQRFWACVEGCVYKGSQAG